jgi:hypothetical protein
MSMENLAPIVNYAALIAMLQKRAGQWAKVGSFAYIPNLPLTLKSHGCEVVTRDALKTDNEFVVWARWPDGAVVRVVRTRRGGAAPQVEWENPPGRRRSGKTGVLPYDDVLQTAWTRPGVWLNVGEVPLASRIPVSIAMRKRGCDVATRKRGTNVGLWVRWPADVPAAGIPRAHGTPEWSDPPRAHVGLPQAINYDAVVALLQSRAGTWASLGAFARSKTEGPQTTLRRKGCVVSIRKDADGSVQVWAMWPPDKPVAAHGTVRHVDGVTWGTPPKMKTGRKARFNYDELLDRMRHQAGQWVKLGVFSEKDAVAVYHALRRRGSKVRIVKNDDGTVLLSGRVLP